MSLRKRVKDLESTLGALQRDQTRWRFFDRQVESAATNKIACGVVGHVLKLESAFVNKKDDNWRYGNFVCTNCFLKVTRKLTDKEIRAAEQLGIL